LSFLAILLVGLGLCVGAISLSLLYKASLARQQDMLRSLVEAEARTLPSLLEWSRRLRQDLGLPLQPDQTAASAREIIRHSLRSCSGFGRTGEYTLGHRVDKKVIEILNQRRFSLTKTNNILVLEKTWGEPMRAALAGGDGILIGKDYRGQEVLAAYTYLPSLGLGLVAKMDMEEVQHPFLLAGIQAAGVGAALAILALLALGRVGKDLLHEKATLSAMVEGLLRHGEAGVYSRSKDGRFYLVNRRFQDWVRQADLSTPEGLKSLPAAFAHREEIAFQRVLEHRQPLVSIETLDYPEKSRILLMQRFPLLDREDHFQGVTTLARDITEEQRSAQEREELGQLFRALIANLRGGYWLREVPSMKLLECTPDCAALWGLTIEVIQEHPEAWLRAVVPEDRDRVARAFRGISLQEGYQAEYQVCSQDGTRRWLREISFHIRDDTGEVIRVGGLIEEVTRQHELQAQLLHSQKQDALGRFAGGIAHDFNNHLTVILGEAEFLAETCEPGSETATQVARILEATNRASRLTRQVLAFGRRQELRAVRLDLREAVSSLEDFMARLVGEDVTLIVDLPEAPMPVEVDPAEIEQIVMNLTTNARDAMPEGGTLTLKVRGVEFKEGDPLPSAEMQPGKYVELSVTDTGEGMSPQVCEVLFEPFFTTKPPGKGTGLGLAMVYGIAIQSGGMVTVESHLKNGSCFHFFLPRLPPENLTLSTPGRSLARTSIKVSTTSTVILVVEDEPMLRDVAIRILTRCGYNVVDAEDGVRAQELLEEMPEPPDLVFTDMVMPGASGSAVAQKALEQGCRRILFTSGYHQDSPPHELLKKLDHGFLSKPYRPRDLQEQIRLLLENQAS
jgi:PAS domain S-box-containing protein